MEIPDSTTATRRCQWCSQAIPAGSDRCAGCGAVAPTAGYQAEGTVEPDAVAIDAPPDIAASLMGEEPAPPPVPIPDITDSLLRTGATLAIAGLIGGLLGVVITPPIASRVFATMLDMPDLDMAAFARLGIFAGVLVGLLAGAGYTTIYRR